MHAIHSWRPRGTAQRLIALVIAAVAALPMAAGCDSEKSAPDANGSTAPAAPAGPERVSPIPSNAVYNAEDVVFAQELLTNHRRAVELIKLAKQRATNPEVKKLATKGEQNRNAGIILLPMWLEKNKQPSPPPLPADKGGGAGASADEVAKLSAATGDAFDRMFLELLIKVDEAADILVHGQQWSGINGPLMSLSHKVMDDGKAELARARQLLSA